LLLGLLGNGKAQAVPNLVSEPLKVCPLRVPYLRILFDGFFAGVLTGMGNSGFDYWLFLFSVSHYSVSQHDRSLVY
jgi:hypothetical protein